MDDSGQAQVASAAGDEPDPTSLQVLLAEYAMLQDSLQLSWNLTQQRTNMFFTVLSATAAAVGLVAQASGLGTGLIPFTVVVLAIALFVRLSTFVRVVQALQEVTLIILGMNRIRRFMRDAAPRYAAFFTLPVNDDESSLHRGIGGMYGHGPQGLRRAYGVLQMPGVLGAINAALAAAAVSIAVASFARQAIAILIGALIFVVVLAASLWYWRRAIDDIRRSWDPVFPSVLPATHEVTPH
jgi:hypothetical protein